MTVVTLSDVVPVPRYDGLPWSRAILEESADGNDPWLPLETVTLSPIDADPTQPQPRRFTADNAVYASGWYRVTFYDAANNSLQTDPVHNVAAAAINWRPGATDVARLLRARTKDNKGNELGIFTSATRPTVGEVEDLIDKAVGTLQQKIGTDPPDVVWDDARDLAAIRAAMLVELSYFPETIRSNHSNYTELKDLWVEGFGDGTSKMPGTLVTATTQAIADADLEKPTEPGFAFYNFPPTSNIGSRPM